MNDFKNYLLRATKDKSMDTTLTITVFNKIRSLKNNEHKVVGDELTKNNLLDYLKNAKVMYMRAYKLKLFEAACLNY